MAVNNGTNSKMDKTSIELLEAFQKLDFYKKAKVMSLVAELDEKKS